jgi:hypothetical protein
MDNKTDWTCPYYHDVKPIHNTNDYNRLYYYNVLLRGNMSNYIIDNMTSIDNMIDNINDKMTLMIESIYILSFCKSVWMTENPCLCVYTSP